MFMYLIGQVCQASNRRHIVVGVVIVIGMLWYGYFALFRASLETIVALLSDDAFYYFQIARNVARGQGCTFDGIAATNGFHPLWMVCLLPIFWIFGGELELPVRIIAAGNGVLCIVTLCILYRLTQKHIAARCGAVAVAACLFPPILNALINGMETGLQLFAVVIVLWLCYKKRIHDPLSGSGSSLVFGVALGVVSLCRLDSVFLLAAALCLGALAGVVLGIPFKRSMSRLALLCAGFGISVAPYIAWNLVSFGQIMPISGAVKNSFPLIREQLRLTGDLAFGAALLALLLGLTAVIVIADRDQAGRLRAAVRSPLHILTIGCVFHFCHAFLFMKWGVYWWHFSVYGLAVAVALAQAIDQLTVKQPGARRWVIGGLVVVMVTVAVPMNVLVLGNKFDRHQEWLAGAKWAREHTGADAVFAIKDAGLFGYFSDRRTVNLDGKANGYKYREFLKRGHVDGYLRHVGVSYIADVSARYRSGESRIRIPRVGQRAAGLHMDEAHEVYRSRAIPARLGIAPEDHFAIWKYTPLRSSSTQ
ncbi:MAG: hypothetical protein JSV19_01350 [Phycisphaerales bacterium]|nr:MAG: hypothetical protein JSV19_01350 [Phycisphaerales bacterium]